MRKITLIMAYYDNPEMLKIQLSNIFEYNTEVKENLEVIIVDDCSPTHPIAEVLDNRLGTLSSVIVGVKISIYRTLIDIPWNQDFCRNLAVSKAANEWVFLTDIDHLIPCETLQKVMQAPDIYESMAYRFARITAPEMTPYKHHPNTWLMTKIMYEQSGGYDEALAGYYGTDGDFTKRLGGCAGLLMREEVIIRVPREYIADASTTRYERKNPADSERKSRIAKERNIFGGWRPLNLSFPWERLC